MSQLMKELKSAKSHWTAWQSRFTPTACTITLCFFLPRLLLLLIIHLSWQKLLSQLHWKLVLLGRRRRKNYRELWHIIGRRDGKAKHRHFEVRKTAARFGIKCVSTLRNHIQGKQSIQAFNANKQLLTPAEEEKIVELLLVSSNRSQPYDYDRIAYTANQILAARSESTPRRVGPSWVGRFVQRHHEKLKTYWSKPLDSQRAKCLNPESVKSWFALVKEHVVDAGILPENIYGMDESGFPPSNQGTKQVVGQRGMKLQHKQGSANRENVTALVTVCADGTSLRPLIIFKAKLLKRSWIDPAQNVAHAEWVNSDYSK